MPARGPWRAWDEKDGPRTHRAYADDVPGWNSLPAPAPVPVQALERSARPIRTGRPTDGNRRPPSEPITSRSSLHAAQQESFAGSRVNAGKASFRPSAIVRYDAQVIARSDERKDLALLHGP